MLSYWMMFKLLRPLSQGFCCKLDNDDLN